MMATTTSTEGTAAPATESSPVVSSSSTVQQQSVDPSLPARTTFQQDLMTAGQRHINVMWERTQQVLAIQTALSVELICVYVIFKSDPVLAVLAFSFLTNICMLVIGTYFQRTNHTKTGGVTSDTVGR